MTNGEKVRRMNNDELASWMYELQTMCMCCQEDVFCDMHEAADCLVRMKKVAGTGARK